MDLILENNHELNEVKDAYTDAFNAQLPKKIKQPKTQKGGENGIPQLDYFEHK